MPTTLITGSNRGIGLSLCKQLSERGEKVIAACRTASDELKALSVSIEEGLDVASDDSIESFAKRFHGTHIDTLILNAGILQRQTLANCDYNSIRQQFEVNAVGPLHLAISLLPALSTGSKIAIISSRMGSLGDNTSGGGYGYRMSKAAVNMAGISLAHDVKSKGIAVAILHPGFVQTKLTGGAGHMTPDESATLIIQRIDALSMQNTGTFMHANGEVLPW